MTARWMLDTNTVSHLIKGHKAVAWRLVQVPMASLCISAITEGELQFDLAKRPAATQLRKAVHEFLQRVDVLAWDSVIAQVYGRLRAQLQASGKTLGSLDLLIGAHALATGSILVTNDKAFTMADGLQLEDWTESE
jgi:tRNA(fMet)-specific endonuclease VapC